jgi:hypothetical protein
MARPRPSHVLARHVQRLAPTSATVQLEPQRRPSGSAPTSTISMAASDGGSRP